MLAYVSGVGSDPPHIWLQQTAGGQAIPVTSGADRTSCLISRPTARTSPSIRKKRRRRRSISPQLYLANLDSSSRLPRHSTRGSRPPANASFIGKTERRSPFLWMAASRLPCLSIRTSAYPGHLCGLPMEKRFFSTATAAVRQKKLAQWWIVPAAPRQAQVGSPSGSGTEHRTRICRARMDSELRTTANGSFTLTSPLPPNREAGSFGRSESLRGAISTRNQSCSLLVAANSRVRLCVGRWQGRIQNQRQRRGDLSDPDQRARPEGGSHLPNTTAPWGGFTSPRPSPGTESGWLTIPTIPVNPTASC